mmetsp:Transcript_24486/g.26778  ORF Transcript_24486/g.26778 Transcript_24486/m.26778 type:complete len:602 (-) Transcript_24486:72-1877(-)
MKSRGDESSSTMMIVGEKGTLEYSSQQVGDSLVALFFALVRDIPKERLIVLFNDCLDQVKSASASSSSSCEAGRIIADLFILTFQTRDCRGGKGERSIFYQLLIELFHVYPETVLLVLPLISEYGYYKDYFNLLSATTISPVYAPFRNTILQIVVRQLRRDELSLSMSQTISLCAKYAPRESNKFAKDHKKLFKRLVMTLYPSNEKDGGSESAVAYERSKMLYRKLLVKLTEAIDVAEVKMCGKRYASIAFDHVPSVCMKRYRKAFANEKLKVSPSIEEMETGNRSDEYDRITCRQNLLQAIREHKIKGKQVFPHEIIRPVVKGFSVSSVESDILQQQWEDIRNDVIRSIVEKTAQSPSGGSVGLGKLVPLVDVSDSMSGTPMEVAIALGILISEVNHPAFRDHLITFETNPHWFNLSQYTSVIDKVNATKQAAWGGSTNIEKAMELIAQTVETNRLSESDIPDLIIFSDMQFDMATGGERSRQSQLERIRGRFTRLGRKLHHKTITLPRVIFWNLRGNTKGFPATSTSENVQLLSGFSASLFKHLVDGETERDTETGKKKDNNKITPYETFRRAMDDERYDKIRKFLSDSEEGHLAQYKI